MSVSFYLGKLKDGVTKIDLVRHLDIQMSNSKARMVLNALGLSNTDDLCGRMDRIQFANLCASWLQQHIGKPSASIQESVTRGTFGRLSSIAAFPKATSISGFANCPKQRERQMTATSSTGVDPPEVRRSPAVGITASVRETHQNRPDYSGRIAHVLSIADRDTRGIETAGDKPYRPDVKSAVPKWSAHHQSGGTTFET